MQIEQLKLPRAQEMRTANKKAKTSVIVIKVTLHHFVHARSLSP